MADTLIGNPSGECAGQFVMFRAATETVTGEKRFDRGAAQPPFVVTQATAAKVINLDADKLDGQDGAFYRNASNLDVGTIPDGRIPNPLPAVSGENLTNLSVIVSTSVTGTQHDFVLSTPAQQVIVICLNASPLTFTGFAGGTNVRRVTIINAAASTVKITNEDAGSSAANRFATPSSQGQIIGTQGRIDLIYDTTTTTRWRAFLVDAGAWIAYTPTWTATGTQPSLGNGTLTGRFKQRGTDCLVEVSLTAGSTTTFGTNQYNWAAPLTGTSVVVDAGLCGEILDSGTAFFLTTGGPGGDPNKFTMLANNNAAGVGQTVPMTWANGDRISFAGTYEIT